MTSQPEKKETLIHILSNISTHFLKNHTENAVEILFSDSFQKKSKLSIYLDQQSFIKFFIVCQVEGYRIILKLICRPFTSYKAFLKIQKSA